MGNIALTRDRRLIVGTLLAVVAVWTGPISAQNPKGPLPLEPQRERGASITPAFEGWFENADGSFTFLLGYYNRNTKEALDIPIGSNNRVEPRTVDQGHPTHFESGRHWGALSS